MSSEKGTTLLEALVYISLLGALFVVIVTVLINSTDTLQSVHALRAVNRSGLLVMERVGETVRRATGLDLATSTLGASPSQLGVVESRDGNATTTVFYIEDGVIQMFDETNLIPLTDRDVTISSFLVEDISIGSTTAVKIDLTIEYIQGTTTLHSEVFHGTFNARGAYDDR